MIDGLVNCCWRWAYRVAYVLATVYWFVRRPKRSGSFVVIWHDGKALLVRNSYRLVYSLPGGLLHQGEDPAVGGVREVAEEVGIALAPDELRLHGVHEEHNGSTLWLYEIQLDDPPAVAIDNREVSWADWTTAAEAAAKPMNDTLRDYFLEKAGLAAPNDEGSS